jgi:hypothetical protein
LIASWPSGNGGIRNDGSADPIQEALSQGALLIRREGGNPTHCFMNFASFAALTNSMSGQIQYTNPIAGPHNITFDRVRIAVPGGMLDVIPDRNCPSNTAFMLTMSTWKFASLKAAPRILNQDTLDQLRVATQDALQVRIGYYGQLYCNAPGFNGRVTLGV